MGSWFRRRFKTYGPEMILDVLEDRIVLDATVDQAAQQNQSNVPVNVSSPDAHAAANSAGTNATADQSASHGLHVILVSDDVKNADQIVQAKTNDATVIVFDSHQDGLAAINAKLSDLVQTSGKKISTIAVLGHGEDGVIEIGTDHISEANLVKFVSAFETLGANLTQDAQIEFFGCSVAAGTNGKALINDIATYTHATVFASTNDTGGAHGNDWTLEYSSRQGTQMESILDTAALAQTDVTLVFSNTPFSWTDDPTQYSVAWGDIDTSDPAGTAGFPNDNSGYGHAEYWTFTVGAGGGYVSFGMQTVYPLSQTNTAFLDSLLRLTTATTGMKYVDDWVGPGSVDLDGDGNDDVNVWDARMVDVYLPQGTYTLECTHYIWTGNEAYRDTGGYTLYSSVRTDLSSEFTPLTMTYDTASGNHLNNEVLSRPVLDVTEPVGFGTYQYDVTGSFGKPADDPVSYRLVSTTPGFLQGIAIDASTGIITFTEAATPVTGSVNVTVQAYSGSLVSASQVFAFKAIAHYDLPTAESARFWVDQNGSIQFWVTGYDPDMHANSQVRFLWDTDYSVQHGTLTADASTLYHDANGYYYERFTYTPTNGYYGLDGFQFTFQTQGGTTWKGYTAGPDDQGKAVGVAPTTDAYNTYAVQFADLNNDGFLDIVEGNYSELNKYYLNDGHGNFPVGHSLGTDVSNTTSIAVGDVNRDGWLDIVAGNENQSDMVYINRAADLSGAWLGFANGATVSNSSTGQEYAVVLGDLDGDGDLDLVRGNYDRANRVHLNDGAGNFDSGTDITSTLTYTRALALGDLNRDGYLDLVVGKGNNNKDLLFLGKGDGTFQAGSTLGLTDATNDNTYSIALGDLNNDGWLDVVTANYGDNAKVYLSSSGTFNSETDLGSTSNSYSVALGDIDRDGDLDVVLSRYGTSNASGRYYLNNGAGTFGTAQTLVSLSVNTRSVAVGDVDGDGDLDVLYGVYNDLDRLILNQGFNTGTGTYHTTAPGVVELNVGLLKYPSFQADNTLTPAGIYVNSSNVGWKMSDANPLSFASTFAIVNNESTTLTYASLQDYYDSHLFNATVDEMQLSFGLPLTVADHTAGSNEQVALLLGNQAHHATLWQDVTLPVDATLAGVDLHWRMAYQNDYYYLNPTTPFDATNQYIAVYVYTPDVNGNMPAGTQPLWITTNNRDAGVVSSLQDYTVHLPASLVPTTAAKNVRVQFELVAQNWFFEAAIDDFALVPVKHTAGYAPPPTSVEVLASSLDTGTTAMTMSVSAPAQSSALSEASTSTSLTSASLTSTLLTTTSSPVVLSDLGTTSVDLGLSDSIATTTSGTLALADYGFATFAFDPEASDSKPSEPSEPSTGPSLLVADAAGQDLTVAFQDYSTDLNGQGAQDTFAMDVAVLASAHDHDPVPANDHIPDMVGKDFDPRLALVLDPAETSALHVLQVQSTALGLHREDNVRDLTARLSAGESLAFDMDSMRLYDL
jgi:hypothetical protein